MSKLLPWILAARPKTLPAAASPVCVGAAMAAGLAPFNWPVFGITLLTALLLQILSNYANDLADFESGADSGERLGPLRVTQAGLISSSGMRSACATITALALTGGAWLVWQGGLPILLCGLFSIYFAYRYSTGSNSLARLGLGELFVIIFFGLVPVAGTYYLLTLQPPLSTLLPGLAIGLSNTAIIVVNNLRDIPADTRSGRKTLAVRFGAGFARIEHAVCLLLAVACLTAYFVLYAPAQEGIPTSALLAAAVLPAIILIFDTSHRQGIELNSTLAKTAAFSAWLAALIVTGLVFS